LVNQQSTTRTTLEREVSLTGVMTNARVRERSNLDTDGAADRRSDERMDVVMEMTPVATPTPTEIADATISNCTERNADRGWRRRTEAPATASD
jgi:hypothetical protein